MILKKELERLLWLSIPNASQVHIEELAEEIINLVVKSIRQMDFIPYNQSKS